MIRKPIFLFTRSGHASVFIPLPMIPLVDERGNVVGVVSAKLNASAALALIGTLPENVNCAVKSIYLLSFLEVFADGQLKLKEPSAKEKKFEDVVKEAEQAAVLVLVY